MGAVAAMDGFRSPTRMLFEGVEGLVLLALCVATWPVSRRWLWDFGALADERAGPWPGDRLLERVDGTTTRAVPVRAPASAVWPWLLQFGLGRGGFHSYELLERLGGIDVHNLERIEPPLQTLAVGDEVRLHPSAPPLTLTLIEPGAHLCFRSWRDARDLAERDPALAASFSLYVSTIAANSCRLIVRSCTQQRRRRRLPARLVASWLEAPLDLVMEQRMLRTVRRLAERGIR